MTTHKKKILSLSIYVILFLVSLSTMTLIIIDSKKPDYYNGLWILPMMFFVYFTVLWRYFPSINYKISAILVIFIYGFRMVFVPLVMNLGNYATYAQDTILERNMNLAIALLCWELTVISIYILTQFGKKSSLQNDIFISKDTRTTFRFKFILTILVLYMVFIFIGTPGLLQESFFLTTGRTEQSSELYFSGQVSHDAYGLSIGSQLVTISFTVFWILQALLPSYLITEVAEKIKSSRLRNILVLLIIFATLLITTEGRAHSIESALALLISVKAVYKNRVRLNSKMLLLLIFSIILFGLMSKSQISVSNTNFTEELSIMVTAYFSGPQNVATAIEAAHDSSSIGIWSIIPDFLQKIPYISKIFTEIFGGTVNNVFNRYFGGANLGQIIPSIGMGYVYFGFFLAPIIPCIAVGFSRHFEEKAQASPDLIRKNLYYLGVIMMARATATSNMLSGVSYLGNIFFTWFLLYISFGKINEAKEKRTLNEQAEV